MYARYTESSKLAVYFARAAMLLNDASVIDSSRFLCGIMWGDESRAQILFQLRESFPLYREAPHKYADLESVPRRKDQLLLTDNVKKVLARAAMAADAMGDYWIDTEHLLLGILAEPTCTAARHLAKAGITLANARRVVIDNKHSRPPQGPIRRLGETPSPMERWAFKWKMWRFRARTKSQSKPDAS